MKNLLTILKAVMAFSGAKIHSHTEHNLTTLTNKSEIDTRESINNNIPQQQDHEFDPLNENKVTKIGWTKGNKIIPFPKNVNQVPEVLPSHITDLDGAFKLNTNVKIKGIENWDTSKVTSFKYVFMDALKFNQPITWDTSSGVDFSSMFQGAKSFNSSLGDKFDTSKGKNFFGMLQGAKSFNQPLGDKFDTRNAESLLAMFSMAQAFNQPLPEKFVIREGVNVRSIFYYAIKFNQDLSYLIVSDKDMNSMTKNTFSWEQENKPISKSDTKSVKVQTRVKEIWNKELKDKIAVAEGEIVKKTEILEKIKEVLKKHASDLDIQDIKLFEDDKDRLINRDPENKLKQTIKIKINNRIGALLDVGKTAEVFTIYIDNDGNEQKTAEKDLSNIQAKEIKQIGYYHDGQNIRAVKMPKTVTKVPDQLPEKITSISNMFEGWGSKSLTAIESIKNWNTTNVVEMNEVFKDSWIWKQDLKWNTQNVTSMKSMFENSWFNGDISSWDIRKVTDMSKMFNRAVWFNNSISSWQIDSLKDISNMFNGAIRFNQDISRWDIKNDRLLNVNDIDINTPAWEDKNKPFPRKLQLKDISEIIKEEGKNVGNFNVSDNEELKTKILEILKQKYPKLDFDSLVLEIKSNTQATLKSVEGENRRYKNEITINYLAKYNISSLDLNPNTGVFNSNEPNAIIQAFISNNADKLDGLTKNDFEVVGDVTNTSLTLKVKDDQQKYQGSITINFTVKINISSLDLNPNTGVFNSNEPNAIIQAFISNNADKLDGLTKNDFEVVGDVTNTSLTLKVKDDQQKYQGSITINFTVKINISSLDLNPNTGVFNSNEPNAIIQAFISNNADKLDGLTKNDFEVVGDVTNTSLTLKVKDDQQKYQGSITINFTVKINISSLDLNPNTGVFNSNEPNAIIQAFISNNADKLDGLTKNDFEVVGDVTNTSLTLKVKDDQQKYQGSITINFTVKTDETNSKQPEKQNNKTAIIASLSSVGGVGVLGPIVAFFRRRKRK